MNKRFIWLVSYPKSGNTWFRIFLSNLLYGDKLEIDINSIPLNHASFSRLQFDEILGIDSSLFTEKEENDLRAKVFTTWGESLDKDEFVKVHESFYFDSSNEPVFPASVSKGVIYIVRNPLDVAVSFSNHKQVDLDKAIEQMADVDYNFVKKRGNDHNQQLSQPMSTWSNHVTSWLDQKHIPVHLIRYEDMLEDAYNTFSNALAFLDIDADSNKIKTAIYKSSFEKLSNMEQNDGFKEHRNKEVTFFWKGKSGNWKNYLSSSQKNKIISDHLTVMKRLSYLDEFDEPVY